MEQYNPDGNYTLPDMGDIIARFEDVISEGTYSWVTRNDSFRLIVPQGNATDETMFWDEEELQDQAIAISAAPVSV